MPNLPAHIALAVEAASGLRCACLQRHLGAYLLGSTAPDIRILTKWERNATHFAPLSSEDVCAGVWGLLQAYPHLRDPTRLSEPTRAFVLGYCSHLIADQAWVVWLYRPFFGNRQVYEQVAEGNVMDRALQLELDRQSRPWVQWARPLLTGAEVGVEVGFIDGATLQRWREWVEWFLGLEFSWERLRSMARRQGPDHAVEALRFAEEFLLAVPQGLERIYQRVPPEQVEAYRHGTARELQRVAQEYLGRSCRAHCA